MIHLCGLLACELTVSGKLIMRLCLSVTVVAIKMLLISVRFLLFVRNQQDCFIQGPVCPPTNNPHRYVWLGDVENPCAWFSSSGKRTVLSFNSVEGAGLSDMRLDQSDPGRFMYVYICRCVCICMYAYMYICVDA